MKLTRTAIQSSIPSLTLQSSGLVILFAFVHTISDAITNMLSALLPTLQSQFNLSETILALLVASLSLSALVTQPLFGALADRVGYRRIAALGVIFNAVLFSLIGIVPNIYILFGLILIGGLGSSALHPAMASMARLAGRNKPDLAVGLFSAGGTLGIAIGPIIIIILLSNLGLSFTPWLMIPGIVLGILMYILSPADTQPASNVSEKIFDLRLLTGPVGLLSLTGILSGVAFVTFTSAMPLWLVRVHSLPNDSTLIGWTLSTFSLAAAAGGIAGGMISNRVGVKRVIVASTLLALLPLYAIFSLTPGSLFYFVAVALAGVLINAGMPLLIVIAQDLSPKNAAAASGMLMGFSAGAAGLVYVGIGRLQEVIGLAPAMSIGYLALIAAAVLASIAINSQGPSARQQPAPIEGWSCLCSPCMDQNIAALPQRTRTS
ncbi:MAG: MFS transporter [Anaerolineales bacterium]|nr:MFS transporter [Anaerolineales bacterium]